MDYCKSIGRMGVVSINPKASSIGVEILKEGGNAVDAYIATQLSLEAYEPGWTGLGGGGFTLIYFNGRVRALDFRETAPQKIDGYTLNTDDISMGYKAVATPGMGRGLETLHKEYGVLGLDYIVKKVVNQLEKGITVSKLLSHSLSIFKDSYKKVLSHNYSRKKFLCNGVPPKPGVKINLDRYIELLRGIAREGFEILYNGYAADILVRNIVEGGGFISERDLRSYKPIWREPIKYTIMEDIEIYTFPPPGSGRLVIELYKGLCKAKDLHETLHYIKWIQDARAFLQDPSLGLDKFKTFISDSESTAHFSVVDSDGDIVSATTTLECFMGSGVTVEGLDILLNDELHDFNLDGEYNKLLGGYRPASSMAPSIIFRDGDPYLVIGASGGKRIFSALAQILYYHIIDGLDIYRSVIKNRVHYDPVRGKYLVEDIHDYHKLTGKGFPVYNTLDDYPSPYKSDLSILMGVAEAILINGEELIGVSDPRKWCGAILV